MVRLIFPTELSDLERKTMIEVGLNPEKQGDVNTFFNYNITTRGRYKRSVFEGKPVGKIRQGKKHRNKNLVNNCHRFTSTNQPFNSSKRGVRIKAKCQNCFTNFFTWSCSVNKSRWCSDCLVEIKRLRARVRNRKLNKPKPNPFNRGQKIKPIIRLTEKTIIDLGYNLKEAKN